MCATQSAGSQIVEPAFSKPILMLYLTIDTTIGINPSQSLCCAILDCQTNSDKSHISQDSKLKTNPLLSMLIIFLTIIVASGCGTPNANTIPQSTQQPAPKSTHTPVMAATPSPIPTSTQLPKTPKAKPTATSHPPDVLFRYTNAVQLLRAAQYEDAIPQFSIVLRVLPDFAKAYHWRGLAYYNDDQKTLALDDFNKAIELKPSFADAYRNRAVLYLNRGDIEQATLDLEQALRIYRDQGNDESMNEVLNLLIKGKSSR